MRCNTCDNCKKLERARNSVLRAANPPFSHADDGVVDVWNTMVKTYPCTNRCQACGLPPDRLVTSKDKWGDERVVGGAVGCMCRTAEKVVE